MPIRTFGALPYDMAHLLGGAALLLSFVLLYQRRTLALIHTYALQAWVLAAAAAWQGWVQSETDLYITAVIGLVAKGVIIPVALDRIAHKLSVPRGVETALGVFPSMMLGVGLVVLSLMVVLPTTTVAQALTREDVASALSVVLLGLLMMITRRNAFSQVIGFLSLENGTSLAAVGMRGMPLVIEMSIAFLVLIGFIVLGVFVFRIRERFDSLDVRHLDDTGLHR
jgi:hydrogenase-4 component E